MNTRSRLLCLPLLMVVGAVAGGKNDTSSPDSQTKPDQVRARPVPRSQAFFGLHFDLHPAKTDTVLGADVTEENITKLLMRVKPDFVQYDCKGHAGYTGYPTKVGWASPGIVKDSLAIWRKVTREHGVGLYIHYSGVWDTVAIEHHPEWARIDASGKRDTNNTSVFGPYVDKLLIPQLKEVTDAYQLDGIWADGECWAAQLDYSPAAMKAWKKETGYADAPKKRDDPHWQEWKMFHRRAFEKYLCHWVDALHAHSPKLQITSNWMYTTLAPKPVVARLDYLSGDYSPTLSVDRARVEARYLAGTGMPWDLMAWGFNWSAGLGHSFKTPVHLQQEAAVVLMEGGGFQIYNTPTRSGYLNEGMIETLGQVADFCRARQKVSHKSTTVPQVALLLSTETQYDRSDKVFHWAGTTDEMEGTLHALLELHYSVDILAEHQLQPRLKEFPLVVIPDSYKLADDFRKAMLNYVNGGGSLLLLGAQCAKLFEPALGVKFEGQPQRVGAELATPGGIFNANGQWQAVVPTTARPLFYRYPSRDTRKGGEIAATLVSHGQGRIAAVYGPVGIQFFNCHHPYLRGFIGDIARQLFPDPAVGIDGPPCIDVSLRRTQDGRLSVHLLNLSRVQTSDRFTVLDYIAPLGPITIKLRAPEKPGAVEYVPDGEKLEWSWAEGVLSATVSRLGVHSVLLVKEQDVR
jgi:hypothetical protein